MSSNGRVRIACRLLSLYKCPPEEVMLFNEMIERLRRTDRSAVHFECEFGSGLLGISIDVSDGSVLTIQEGTQASRWPMLEEGDRIVSVHGVPVQDSTQIVESIRAAPRPVTLGFRKSEQFLWREHMPCSLLACLVERFTNVLRRNRLYAAHMFPCYVQGDGLAELNRRFGLHETLSPVLMCGLNTKGFHLWDTQRGLIETLDFCELVSWGQARLVNWVPNEASASARVLQNRIELVHLAGGGTVMSAGTQMQVRFPRLLPVCLFLACS